MTPIKQGDTAVRIGDPKGTAPPGARKELAVRPRISRREAINAANRRESPHKGLVGGFAADDMNEITIQPAAGRYESWVDELLYSHAINS